MLTERQPAVPRQLVAGPDTSGEHDQVDVDRAVGQHHPGDRPGVQGLQSLDPGASVHRQAETFDVTPQHLSAALVHLSRHEPGGGLDHMRSEAEAAHRVGGLEAEQPPADDSPDPTVRRVPADRIEVLDRPVDEAAGQVGAGYGRDERRRAGASTRASYRIVRPRSVVTARASRSIATTRSPTHTVAPSCAASAKSSAVRPARYDVHLWVIVTLL